MPTKSKLKPKPEAPIEQSEASETNNKNQRLWIPGRCVGKARPIVTKSGTYYPENYRNWKDFATAWSKEHLRQVKYQCKIDCQFVNFASSDIDNLVGSVIDALVRAEILENDSSRYVSGCSGIFVKTKKKRGEDKPLGTIVDISPREIQNVIVIPY